ncbi:hypothetical protein [Deinococcus cellulosilyticus]|uniref:Uncharacterized protein n=1 Tax=Deinococcus cellulosilyticus (strain DSM 18568 / NBRC 106333 / KACC 11606 / 5516J-15) TaxID=1223518 RepID=A0A511N0H7_DEIC1|nr:hypothetical protein [Deinococcus cellulosilyticus]GEM45886.1 hypothetical protein DC3_15210 [Deinococcus cellulosilyticus NBRC 106333 = KACC 11606]
MLKPVGKPTAPPPAPLAPKKKPYELINEMADRLAEALAKHGEIFSAYNLSHQNKIVWLAGSVAVFSTWVEGNLWTWKAPAGYNTRLTRAAAWIQGQEEGQLRQVRDQVIKVLDDTWPAFFQICSKPEAEADGQMLFARLPTLWVPDEEFGPVHSGPVPVLPIWEDTPCGRTAEQWDVYAGLLCYLNIKLGFDVLDMSPSDLPF